ncbi:hypothetical protein B5M47_03510 [candidate division CPR3 bacterium 4484_211]|uniref:Uncharacterized protein n=1 Tax=candidate division CPR3 bacterium 4484_211 TaxID=1968527 RepID=A0A1W9NX56_UNCC3|nr:MAG: hypothetical protein B5M47_03510 [candidate division CPR3 bacterium 4484_211]
MRQADVCEGNADLVERAVDLAIRVREELSGRISQQVLDREGYPLRVGTGFFLTTLRREDGSSREEMAVAFDKRNRVAKSRLIISGALPGSEVTWLLVAKDEGLKAPAGQQVERPLVVGKTLFCVRRFGPPSSEGAGSQSALLENDNLSFKFPTEEENASLYDFIVQRLGPVPVN